jgi:hypothetical protein
VTDTSTDTPPIAWRDAAPWPGSETRDMGTTTLPPEQARTALAAHFAAMAWAHLEEYGTRMTRWRDHCDACAATRQPAAGQHLRDLIRDYLEPGIAAFAAAAALHGRTAEQIIAAAENAQTMHELVWDWLPRSVDADAIALASAPIPADIDPAA